MNDSVQRTPWTPIPILLLVCPMIFWPVLRNDFVNWDDNLHVSNNEDFLPPSLDKIEHYWRGRHLGMYIPLTYTIWAGLADLVYVSPTPAHPSGHLTPTIFHAANLLLHTASVLLIYTILARLLQKAWPALLGALLFAVHPLQVEPVAWVMGMKDLLSATLALAALALYLRPSPSSLLSPRYFLATFLFALSLLAKPSTVVIPAIALLLDVLIVGRAWKPALRSIGPWILLAGSAALLARVAQPPLGELFVGYASRPIIVCDTISHYLATFFYPRHLRVDYGRTPQWVLAHPTFALVALALILPLVVLQIARKPLGKYLAVVGIFLAALFPVLGIFSFDFQQYSTVADRYMYLAMLAPALVTALLLARFDNWPARIVCLAVVAGLGVLSTMQARVWRDTESLFTHNFRLNPRSYVSQISLAAAAHDAHDNQRALPHARLAVELADAYSIARKPRALAHDSLGRCYAIEGQLDRALGELEYAVSLTPQDAALRRNLALVHQNRGLDLRDAGNLPGALNHLHRALELLPDDSELQELVQDLKKQLK